MYDSIRGVTFTAILKTISAFTSTDKQKAIPENVCTTNSIINKSEREGHQEDWVNQDTIPLPLKAISKCERVTVIFYQNIARLDLCSVREMSFHMVWNSPRRLIAYNQDYSRCVPGFHMHICGTNCYILL